MWTLWRSKEVVVMLGFGLSGVQAYSGLAFCGIAGNGMGMAWHALV